MANHVNLLFVCSRNQWRSPTAEKVWRKQAGYRSRSVGTSPKARKSVGLSDINWADMIFVMEQKHQDRLVAMFTRAIEHKSIYILDIPDEYKYMDPDLVSEIEYKVSAILGL